MSERESLRKTWAILTFQQSKSLKPTDSVKFLTERRQKGEILYCRVKEGRALIFQKAQGR